jgi:hypothetical protein
MIAGQRYILLGAFDEDKSGGKALALDACGVIPYTEQNLSAIQRGIQESSVRQAKLRELGLPLR